MDEVKLNCSPNRSCSAVQTGTIVCCMCSIWDNISCCRLVRSMSWCEGVIIPSLSISWCVSVRRLSRLMYPAAASVSLYRSRPMDCSHAHTDHSCKHTSGMTDTHTSVPRSVSRMWAEGLSPPVRRRVPGLRMSLSNMLRIWLKVGLSARSFSQQSNMSWCSTTGQSIGAGRR